MPHPTQPSPWLQAAAPLVGRHRELTELDALSAHHRLITLAGPGGVGKTRLALAWLERQALPTWRCDLSHGEGLEAICAAVARALDAPVNPAERDPEAVARQLGHALEARGAGWLLLDNAEHLTAQAPATIGRWHAMAPELRLLVTSRQRLGLRAEVVYEVGPLGLIEVGEESGSEAAALFEARARAARRTFAVTTDEEREAVKAIVAALDGLPLAIELAAAQMHMLTPRQLLRRMEDKLDLLVDGPRDMAERHRTLRRAIDGSWALLSEAARLALAQCAVFRGGFSVDAAEALLDLPAPHKPLAALRELREASLVRAIDAPDAPLRLGLYNTVRDYAHERLVELRALEATRRRHALTFGAPRLVLQGRRLDTPEAVTLLQQDAPNLEAALRFAAAHPDAGDLRRAAIGAGLLLARLYALQGPLSAWRRVLDLAVQAAAGDGEPEALGRLLSQRAQLQGLLGEVEAARATLDQLEEALDQATEAQPVLRARALRNRATLERMQAAPQRAEPLYRSALERLEEAPPEPHLVAEIQAELAGVLLEQRRLDEARRAFGAALAQARALKNARLEGFLLTNLGVLCQELGDMDAAAEAMREALALHRRLGYRRFEGITLGDMASIAWEQGRPVQARRRFEEARAALQSVGDRPLEALHTAALAGCLATLGHLGEARRVGAEATRLLGAATPTPVGRAAALYLKLGAVAEALAAWRRDGDDAPLEEELERLRGALAVDATPPDEVRLAARIVRRWVAQIAARDEALLVDVGRRSFRAPSKKWRALDDRPALAQIFEACVEARLERPGQGLSREALQERGWPGEAILPEAAVNRLHVALNTLRRFGLRGLLVHDQQQYHLAPEVVLLLIA